MIKGDNILSVGTPSGGGISIIANNPVTSGGGGGFTPITTALAYFLDAQTGIYTDAGSTEATDGQAIQQINDQSTSAITATNTNVGYQATYAVASVNGLNSLRLEINNANDTYLLSSNVNVTNLYTIHYIYKKDALADASVIMSAYQQLFGDGANGYTYLFQGTTYNSYDGGDDWTVASFVQKDGDTGNFQYYINGILMTNAASSAPVSFAIDRLFQRPSARVGEFNVADVLVYTQVQSLSDVAFTQNGLNEKYGQLFLPIDDTLPTPPTIGSTTLEWYHNPDYNTYSDVAQTAIANLDYIRSAKITTGTFASMVQNTASEQMQYKTTVLPNGKASYHKGYKDYMHMNEEKVFTASESFVAYSVHKKGQDGTNAIFGKEGDYDNSIMDWSSGYIYYKANSGTAIVTGVTYTSDTVVRAYVIDRDADLLRVYQNGVQVGSASISSITVSYTHLTLPTKRIV